MKPSLSQRTFNATVEGQKAMCADAGRRATVLILNAKVRALGGATWHDSMITTANESLLGTIMEDLRQEYNKLISPK